MSDGHAAPTPPDAGGGPPPCLLTLDSGTTNTKALLVRADTAEIVAVGSSPLAIEFPAPGWVEQDADDMWAAAVAAIDACLGQAPDAPIVGLALSNQRESVVGWSRSTGEPVGPVLGWQDARTAEACQRFDPAARQFVRQRTGLTLDPMFSAPKMRWLLDYAVARGFDAADVLLGTVDSWLVWRFTGEHAAEAGNASRTLLFDLESLSWSAELQALFGIPASALAPVRASDAGFGTTTGVGLLPAGIPLVAVMADSHAAMYHHGCTTLGEGKATYGTGSSVMTPCPVVDSGSSGVATTLAWLTDAPTYAREGNIIATGSAIDWMGRITAVTDAGPAGDGVSALAATASDAGGVTFVPAFSGLGAPYFDRTATGIIAGIAAGTTRSQLARAALESVAHQVVDVVEAMEADGAARIDTLHADGGGTASGLLMSMQADLLGRPIRVGTVAEASALGVALLASRTLGMTEDADTASATVRGRLVQPTMTEPNRREARRAWASAVARSRGRAVTPDDTSGTTAHK
jgi:glycerol kinase